MPFLCVLPKLAAGSDEGPSSLDASRLTALLCPYAGELRRIELRRGENRPGELWVSRLADTERQGALCAIPRGTHKPPQSAWVEIKATSDLGALRFETDPLGTFPLWIFEDGARVVITSEVKALLALAGARVELALDDKPANQRRAPNFSPYRNVRRVAPGAVLRIDERGQAFEEARAPLTYRPSAPFTSREESAAHLDAALSASAASVEPGAGSWATFLSGGIDSSIATALMAKLRPGLRTFTLGTDLGNEYADAKDLAGYLGARHGRVFASEADALRHFERAVFCNETIDGLTAETVAQLSVLAQAAAPEVKHVVTGYGADLLFGSMLRHELYTKVTGVDDLQSLIERTAWSGEFSPFYAWSLGIDVHHLFWHPALMNCAFKIPAETSFDGTREKIVLRDLAVARGYMQPHHANRKKQALTDGTQFNRVLSSALGLSSPHAYDRKNAACVSLLAKLFQV